jgi:hypothetical protein
MNMPSLATLKSSPAFWQGAFIFAVLLLIFSHKISVEGMIGAKA